MTICSGTLFAAITFTLANVSCEGYITPSVPMASIGGSVRFYAYFSQVMEEVEDGGWEYQWLINQLPVPSRTDKLSWVPPAPGTFEIQARLYNPQGELVGETEILYFDVVGLLNGIEGPDELFVDPATGKYSGQYRAIGVPVGGRYEWKKLSGDGDPVFTPRDTETTTVTLSVRGVTVIGVFYELNERAGGAKGVVHGAEHYAEITLKLRKPPHGSIEGVHIEDDQDFLTLAASNRERDEIIKVALKYGEECPFTPRPDVAKVNVTDVPIIKKRSFATFSWSGWTCPKDDAADPLSKYIKKLHLSAGVYYNIYVTNVSVARGVLEISMTGTVATNGHKVAYSSALLIAEPGVRCAKNSKKTMFFLKPKETWRV